MRWIQVCAVILAVWVAAAFAFTPLRSSHDEWWHLKTGQWLAQHGELPEHDIFTYTAADVEWHNHEWLAQVMLYGVYRLGLESGVGGWRLVILLKSLFIVMAYIGLAWLVGRRLRYPVVAALAGALAAALARRTFYPRPPFISYLLLALIFWLLIEWRAGRLRGRWLWMFLPMFALWANLHGGWAAGLVLLGAFWAERLCEVVYRVMRKRDWMDAARGLGLLTALGIGCTAATLINPYGYQLYEIFYRVLGSEYLVTRIGEMRPPDWGFVWVLEGIILLMAALAIRPTGWISFIGTLLLLGFLHLVLRGTANAWVHTMVAVVIAAGLIVRIRPAGWGAHLLLVCFFFQQGLHHVRHLSLLAIFVLPILIWGMNEWGIALEWRLRRSVPRVRQQARWILSGGVLTILVGLWGFWLFSQREFWSYMERNWMLARGIELQPVVAHRPPEMNLPVPSRLPTGVFLIEPYPIQAVDFFLRAELPTPLWNGGNYAGYLIWRLAPEHARVFTDNRYDVYGDIAIRQEHSVLEGWKREKLAEAAEREGMTAEQLREEGFLAWDEVLKRWEVQTIMIPVEAPGNARLQASGEWVRVWEDFQFNLWVLKSETNEVLIARAMTMPRPTPWLPFSREWLEAKL